MAEGEKLPATATVTAMAVLTEQRGSLVARGLAALKEISLTTPTLLCFTNKGHCIAIDAAKAPRVFGEWCATDFPQTAQLLVPNRAAERIIAVLRTPTFDENHFVFMATAFGRVKKMPLSEFSNLRKVGVIVVGLDEGDNLISVAITNGQCDVMLCSDAGKAVLFAEDDVRPMSHAARGVRGMMLEDGQREISMLVADSEKYSVLTATENGFGKRTPIAEYTRHGRGTKGMIAIQTSDNGKVVGASLIVETDEVILSTSIDREIRTCVSDIPETRRVAHGALLVELQVNESLVGLSVNSCPMEKEHLATLLDLVKQQISVFIEGLFRQGLLYRYGEGVDVDIDKAWSFFIEAAELDPARARHELAQLLIHESESVEGAKLFKQGLRYRYGDDGVHVDNDKAREYFTEAAEMDHAEAQFELALLLAELEETDDPYEWLNTSAEQGFGPAIRCLIVERDGLHGLDIDEQEELLHQASEWYWYRAIAGDAKRQFEFSELLLCWGDQQEGMRWLKASAEQDYSEACYRLGFMCEEGRSVEEQGKYWHRKAAEQGFSYSEDISRNEIFFMDRDCAENTANPGLEREFQTILLLKGKEMSSWEIQWGDVFGSNEVQEIALALGIEPHDAAAPNSVLANLHYGKIIVMPDSDVGFCHIQHPLLALFCRHFPKLIEHAHIWGALTRYRVDCPGYKGKPARRLYVIDDGYLIAIKDRLSQGGIGEDAIKVTRCKGLGEMTKEQLREFLSDLSCLPGAHFNYLAVYWYSKAAEQGHEEAQTALEYFGIDWKAP